MSAVGHHTSKETVVDGISSVDEPSVEWGWHQHSTKVGLIAGSFFVLFLLAMLFGNHIGRVEDIYLVSIAAFLAIWMFLSLRPKKDLTLKKSRILQLPADHYSVTGAAASGAIGTHSGAGELAPAKR